MAIVRRLDGAAGVGLLAALYLVSLGTLAAIGVVPVLPWRFVAFVVLVALPFAYGVAHGIFLVETRWRGQIGWRPTLYIGTGLLLLGVYRLGSPVVYLVGLALLAAAAWHLGRGDVTGRRRLGVSIVVLTLGYGLVWNLNYVAAWLTADRLRDGELRAVDHAVYGWLLGRSVAYEGIFPLVDSRLVFQMLENAYLVLFVEVFVVIFVLLRTHGDLGAFFRRVFTCYLAGLVVFAVFPVVGPCIAVPESFRAVHHGTLTHELMRAMAAEYVAVTRGAAVNGFGYFVGLPSLHVAMAVLLQGALYPSRGHFWALLPVNVLLALSTVLLGYHYLADAPAGALLGLLVLAPGWRRAAAGARV